jgi:urease subunit gamma
MGRRAMGETVASGLFDESFEVRYDDRLVLADRQRFRGRIADLLARPAVAGGAKALVSLLYVGDGAATRLGGDPRGLGRGAGGGQRPRSPTSSSSAGSPPSPPACATISRLLFSPCRTPWACHGSCPGSGPADRFLEALEVPVHLGPRDKDKLLIAMAAMVARRRLERGVKLNYPEAIALISDFVMEGARDGRTVADLMTAGAEVLTRDQVMEASPRWSTRCRWKPPSRTAPSSSPCISRSAERVIP